MDIITISLLAIVVSVIIIMLKELKPDISLTVSIAFGVFFLFYALNPVTNVISVFSDIAKNSGIDNEILSASLKVVGISLIAEFASSICNDAGQSSVASKVEFTGKLMILTLSLPIINSMLDSIFKILP